MSECHRDGERCEQSDLPRWGCAHCRGDQPLGVEPEPRRYVPTPRGRRIWPEPRRQPVAAKPPPPEEPTGDPKVLVARDLRAIGHMAALLGDRALDLADDPHIVGGEAMVNLAPFANLEAWQHQVETDERLAGHALERGQGLYTSLPDEDPDEAWPAYQTLRFWSEDWRRERGIPDIEVPTIATETRFLADSTGWAWASEPHFEEFAADVKAARTKLENVVRDGIRETRSRVVCDRCANPKRLIRKYGKAGRPDTWKAPCCQTEFTADDAKRALARQLKSAGVERRVTYAEAISAMKVQGWSEATVRGWLADDDVATFHDELVPSCWWPDVWRRHLLAAQEREARARKRAALAERKAACAAAHGADCWERGCSAGRRVSCG